MCIRLRNALLVGTNQSRYLVSGTLAETIANVLFDYLFIFGNFGFPEMGLNGAAVASIIAEFTACLSYLLLFIIKESVNGFLYFIISNGITVMQNR
jgi:Na+-driven multidrug efflux pump